MQAVILSAGASTRFYPLSEGMPKPMVCLLGQPILAHTIQALAKMGVKNIILVTGQDPSIKDYFGNGEKFGVKITYVLQEKPLGMADALLRAKKLIKEDFFLLHGHHLDIGDFVLPMVEKKRTADTVLLSEERENFWEYGVVELKAEKVSALVEKPLKSKEASKPCVVGIYLLTEDFISFLEKAAPSHYQLETGLDKWAKTKNVVAVKAQNKALSLKYSWDLLKIKNYLLEKAAHRISRGAKIGKGVILVGKMVIEDEATILENAVIKGPVYLGKNVLVGNNALVRNGSVLEENSRIGAFSEVKNSIFLPNSTLGSGFVASSIIGQNCRLAHGFISANRRFDRKTIKVKIKGKEIDSNLDDLGVIMGEGVYAGIGVGTMPGKTIGKDAIIGPGTFVFEDIPPGLTYSTKFKEEKFKTTPEV